MPGVMMGQTGQNAQAKPGWALCEPTLQFASVLPGCSRGPPGASRKGGLQAFSCGQAFSHQRPPEFTPQPPARWLGEGGFRPSVPSSFPLHLATDEYLLRAIRTNGTADWATDPRQGGSATPGHSHGEEEERKPGEQVQDDDQPPKTHSINRAPASQYRLGVGLVFYRGQPKRLSLPNPRQGSHHPHRRTTSPVWTFLPGQAGKMTEYNKPTGTPPMLLHLRLCSDNVKRSELRWQRELHRPSPSRDVNKAAHWAKLDASAPKPKTV